MKNNIALKALLTIIEDRETSEQFLGTMKCLKDRVTEDKDKSIALGKFLKRAA